MRAISRRDRLGSCSISRSATLRPSIASIGRTRPSRPILVLPGFDLFVGSDRISAMVLADSPVAAAIIRSDHCGCDAVMRSAALLLSVSDNGKPCVILARTANTKASASLPSKNRTRIVSCPRSFATSSRCIPSITRIVGLCTIIGGSALCDAASEIMCSALSPPTLGESEIASELIATATMSCSSRELCSISIAR